MKDFDAGGGRKRLCLDGISKSIATFEVQGMPDCASRQCSLACGVLRSYGASSDIDRGNPCPKGTDREKHGSIAGMYAAGVTDKDVHAPRQADAPCAREALEVAYFAGSMPLPSMLEIFC